MADIKTYTDQIQNAVYGEEVRSSIINALNKVNDDNNSYQSIKNAVVAAKNDVDTQQAAIASNLKTGAITLADLRSATSVATSTKSDLDDVVATAVSTNNTLAATNKSATDTNAVVKTTITSADTANTTLKNTINTANAANTTLTATIGSTNAAKTAADTATANANTAKSKLDTSIATANTTQTAIDAKIAAAKTNLAALQSENYKSSELLNGVEDVKAYIGMCDDDMIGVEIDYNTGKYTRLGAAEGLSAGSNFDQFTMFGGRKRCNLADDGTINAYYGDSGYKEDGSNGQVMVYQPAFYYKVVPLKLEKQNPGIGYHLRKARYYVSANPHPGFKLHPAFYNAAGNEVDHIFLSAYEASIYDTSASAYLKLDEQVMDTSADKLCSIAGVKPASGYSQALTRPAIELLAQNRGKNWHGDLIKAESANQLLMLIEYAGNLQNLIEQGDVTFPYTGLGGSDTESYAVDTGGTASLGNATGHAASSTQHINGNTLTNTVNGKRSISYRGIENPWGNLWKWVYGINIWGNGSMCGGQPYICKDFTFAENKNSDNYEAAGFTLTNANGFISAVGYSASCDWTFLPSECKGNDSIPIGDYSLTEKNVNGFRIARLGAGWNGGSSAGGFSWALGDGVGGRSRHIGGRLLYMP